MCFFTKSYWDFFFPSFNYHSEHVATCFIVESCTLFPAALLRACLPLEGLLIPGWSLQAVSDSSSSGWSSWGSLSCFRNWLTRKLFLSQCSNPGEVGLQTCCPGSDGAVSDGAMMGTCQCHPPHAMGWPSALLQHALPRAAVLSNPSHAFLEKQTSASELLSAVKMGPDFS